MEYTKTVVAQSIGWNDEVVGVIQLPLSQAELWAKAHNPTCFSDNCPNLSYYKTDSVTKVGNKIEEIHTFLSFPQRYTGTIESFVLGKSWSMFTTAVGISAKLFSLPHFVEYKVTGDENKSQLSIRCTFRAKGLLGLPGIRTIVRNQMAKTIGMLLVVPIEK